MNKKIITSLLFCMSLAAHAENFIFSVKDKENKLIQEVTLYTVKSSPTSYYSTKNIFYVNSCEQPVLENSSSLSTFPSDLPVLVTVGQGEVKVGTFLNITNQTDKSVQLTYDLSELTSMKIFTSSNCSVQLPEVEQKTASANILIKLGETVLLGDFLGNVLSLTRN